jgi:hypothetical protein
VGVEKDSSHSHRASSSSGSRANNDSGTDPATNPTERKAGLPTGTSRTTGVVFLAMTTSSPARPGGGSATVGSWLPAR